VKRRTLVWGLALCCLAALSLAIAFVNFGSRQQKQSAASFVSRFLPPLRSILGQKSSGSLNSQLQQAGFVLGQSVLLRIYKQESELEVWLMRKSKFEMFNTYPICKWSGQLGPKLSEGDGQSPEGFYEVAASQLNPNSRYHLAFNIGFPNAFDLSKSRTGSALMVHGSCVSIGCYAMTDSGIEDIYVLVEEALLAQQSSVPIHIFPFRMTQENLNLHATSPWAEFWSNLAEGDAMFQRTQHAPKVSACGGRYYFDTAPENCERVKAW
jgi:murein L,D-transpeptidase YafK